MKDSETGEELGEARTTFDPVKKPKHYNLGGIECIDALAAATTGLEGIDAVCTANAIKYLWRWKHKNGVEDLKKAIWYIEKLISAQRLIAAVEPVDKRLCLNCGKSMNGAQGPHCLDCVEP